MPTPDEPSNAAPTERCHLLLVHDDVAVQAVLGVLLAPEVLFEAVSTATEGLNWLYTLRPTLVILDTALRDLNGLHFLHVLRSYVPHCPVLLITSSPAEVMRHITAFGVVGCWSRPLQCEALLAQLCWLPPFLSNRCLLALRGSSHTCKAIDYLCRHYLQPLTVPSIATALHISPSHLTSVFRRAVGMSVKAFLMQVRIEVAKRLLATTDMTLESLAECIEFCDASHVSRVFRRKVGCWPGEYRRQARGLVTALSPPTTPTETTRPRHLYARV